MNYEQFKDLWTWALRESGLPLFIGELVESLDLRSTDRHCKSFVHLPSDLAATFKAAMRNGLIRSFPDRQLELELRFLQEVNGCAKAPTTGPCTTDDVAMCALVLAKQILGDAGGYGAELGGLPLGGHPGIGNHPLGEQFSAAGGGRRASYPQRPSRISRWHRTRRAS